MSYKELAHNLIDQIPETKMYYIVSYLQGATVPDEVPNAETLAAIEEVDEMIQTGNGQHFQGTAEEFTNMLLSEV